MHNDIEYGIKITYSWGDEEPIIAIGSKGEAWEEAIRLAGKEAAIASIESDSTISLYFDDEKRIILGYMYDNAYCYYDIVPVHKAEIQKSVSHKKENDMTDKFRHMIESFECDFNLAMNPESEHTVADLQKWIDEGNEKIISDIHLLQELSFLLRNGRAKIIEIEK